MSRNEGPDFRRRPKTGESVRKCLWQAFGCLASPLAVDEMESLSEFVLLLTGGDILEFGSQLTEQMLI